MEFDVSLDSPSEPQNNQSDSQPAQQSQAVADKPSEPKRESAVWVQRAEAQRHTESESKPAGYEPVDPHTASPEQIQERLKYLYRQVKDGERTRKEERRILEEQSRLIQELSQSQHLVINHLQEKNIVDSEASVTAAMQAAWERGDVKAYNEAQARLIEIKVEKKMLGDKRQAAPQQQVQQQVQQRQQQYGSAADIADQAVQGGELSESDRRITQAWQDETDSMGAPLRPWAYDTHPQFRQALIEGRAVFTNPRYANMPYEQKLAEIDRRMGVVKKDGAQNVIGGSLQSPRKSARISISPEIEKMVTRTKWGGDKYKSNDERLAAYAKQIASVRGNRTGGQR